MRTDFAQNRLRRLSDPSWVNLGLVTGIVGFLLIAQGCSVEPPVEPPADPELPQTPVIEARETWDVFFINDAKVGFSHTIQKPVDVDSQPHVEIFSTSEMTVQRFGQTVKQEMSAKSVEKPDGQLLRFESAMTGGGNKTTCEGSVADGNLRMETGSLGKTQASSIEWDGSATGFFGVEQSLERNPMKPGETRRLKSLQPFFNQIADVTLKADDYEETQLLEGTSRLLRIDNTTSIGNVTIDTIIWTDEKGVTQKSLMPTLNETTYRTTKEIALSETDVASFDIGEATVVELNRALIRPHQTTRVVYRAQLKRNDPTKTFWTGLSQSVLRVNDDAVEITVLAIRPDSPESIDSEIPQPTDDDRNPNNMIQSDDPLIVKIAENVAPDETDVWKLAYALEQHVKKSITAKNFSKAFSTAAEVAQSLEGDCTEHSVLLAALCRARRIPARVAIGLVYFSSDGDGGFAYHMWNEVWIRDRWIPLDGTLGQGGIGAAHIKLDDSNLQGASAYSTFLPVFNVMGQLKLEIDDVEY